LSVTWVAPNLLLSSLLERKRGLWRGY